MPRAFRDLFNFVPVNDIASCEYSWMSLDLKRRIYFDSPSRGKQIGSKGSNECSIRTTTPRRNLKTSSGSRLLSGINEIVCEDSRQDPHSSGVRFESQDFALDRRER